MEGRGWRSGDVHYLSLSLALLPHQFLCTLFHNNNNSEINRFTARNQLILVVCDD